MSNYFGYNYPCAVCLAGAFAVVERGIKEADTFYYDKSMQTDSYHIINNLRFGYTSNPYHRYHIPKAVARRPQDEDFATHQHLVEYLQLFDI